MSSVDVIVPCYRYAHFLKECVGSVLNQHGPDIRVLIINDCSPDNTAEVAFELSKSDSRIQVLTHQINKRHIATYNEGIEWASGDYMLILSADDYLLPGSLDRATKLLDNHPEVGFVFGRYMISQDESLIGEDINEVNVEPIKDWRILSGFEFMEFNGPYNIVSTATAVVRTELQKRVGGYRVELPHSGDLEMWLRFAAHASVGFLTTYQAVYRRHSENMSISYLAQNWLPDIKQRKEAFDFFFREFSSLVPNSKELYRNLSGMLAYEGVGLASSAFNEGEMKVCKELLEFALKLDPGVRRLSIWYKVRLKQFLGFRLWRVLHPTLKMIRLKAF